MSSDLCGENGGQGPHERKVYACGHVQSQCRCREEFLARHTTTVQKLCPQCAEQYPIVR